MNILLFSLISSVAAIAYGLFLMWQVLRKPTGDEKMRLIARAIQEGAWAYLKREFVVVLGVGVVLALVLWRLIDAWTTVGFVIGAVASLLAGYIGMFVAIKSNVRVTEAARQDFPSENLSGQAKLNYRISTAFNLAFKGGSVTGFLVAGLALFSLTFFYWWAGDVKPLVGLAFGGSLVSVFARLGGGIFTKGADVE